MNMKSEKEDQTSPLFLQLLVVPIFLVTMFLVAILSLIIVTAIKLIKFTLWLSPLQITKQEIEGESYARTRNR